MTWVKLTDSFAEDPRLEAAGPEAFVIHVAGLCYCNRVLSDGAIPARAARRLWSVDDPDAAIAALVDNGLWKSTEDGYEIVGFLDNQRSADVVRREQQLKAQRQRRWLEKKRAGRNESIDASHSSSKDASIDAAPAPTRPARNKVEEGVAGSPGSAGATPPRRQPEMTLTPVTFTFETEAA